MGFIDMRRSYTSIKKPQWHDRALYFRTRLSLTEIRLDSESKWCMLGVCIEQTFT